MLFPLGFVVEEVEVEELVFTDNILASLGKAGAATSVDANGKDPQSVAATVELMGRGTCGINPAAVIIGE